MDTSSGVGVYLRIVWKRAWLILLILAATLGIIFLNSLTSEPLYRATVRLQVIASEAGEVALFSQFRTGVAQDEITAAQQDFIAALRRPIVAWQTIADLNMSINATDVLDHLTAGTEEDFINISYESANPRDVEAVVTKLVDNALKYYRESRAQRAVVLREFIAQEMESAKNVLSAAKDTVQQFKLKNNLSSLDRELAAYQDEIRTLRLTRDQAALQAEQSAKEADLLDAEALRNASQADDAAARGASSTATYFTGLARDFGNQAASARVKAQSQQIAKTTYDQIIVDRENRLLGLIALSGEMDSLQSSLTRAQANYDFLASKFDEAQLKERQSLNAGFIQIVEPARQPDRPTSIQTSRWLMVGGAMALLVGIILAFVIELIESAAKGASHSHTERGRE
jgi:uncharacterized protein involved in exopolysaccharide biosynthesis